MQNRKRVLITGGTGFVGKHLVEHLLSDTEWDVTVTKLQDVNEDASLCNYRELDLLKAQQVTDVVSDIAPDYIFHLAAQSSVSMSWKDPTQTIEVNVLGSLNLLEALRTLKHTHCRTLMIGSSEEYGSSVNDHEWIPEDSCTNPNNIYAATKTMQNTLGRIYHDAYGIQVVMTRSFNHSGPGQTPQFVLSDFAHQIAMIEKHSLPPIIKVGNLSAIRDFTDVRDVVKAYSALVQHGEAGEIYNVGTGKGYTIKELLNLMLSLSPINIEVSVEEERVRPIETPRIIPDISKIKEEIHWEPQIPMERTLLDLLNYWRDLV